MAQSPTRDCSSYHREGALRRAPVRQRPPARTAPTPVCSWFPLKADPSERSQRRPGRRGRPRGQTSGQRDARTPLRTGVSHPSRVDRTSSRSTSAAHRGRTRHRPRLRSCSERQPRLSIQSRGYDARNGNRLRIRLYRSLEQLLVRFTSLPRANGCSGADNVRPVQGFGVSGIDGYGCTWRSARGHAR